MEGCGIKVLKGGEFIMAFTFEKTKIPVVVIIQPKVFGDSRGYFMETYKKGGDQLTCLFLT